MDAKKYLRAFFEFGIFQLDNNLCTPEEIDAFAKTASENIPMKATIKDMAKFFGKSENAVKLQIHNKMNDKPERNVVLYPFHKFLKMVSDKWLTDK